MKIKIDQFEGPLHLLLQLIEKEEMDVTEISIAKVTDQYIEHIKSSHNISPEEMATFLVVAARLLLIKSRAMLPYLYPEEEEDIEDLESQLKLYKEFLDASKNIEKILGKKKFMFAREFNRKVVPLKSFIPPSKVNKAELKLVFSEFLTKIKPAEKMKEGVVEDKINIEDKIF